jgi:hypothetical protein
LNYESPLSVIAVGGMLMYTAFAPISIVSVYKIYMGRYNAARCPISMDIASKVQMLLLKMEFDIF